jgi:hypothetical protein
VRITFRDLEQLDRAIANLRDDRDAGLFDDNPDDYRLRVRNRVERRKTLAKLPQRPDGWVDVPTGQTYAERWAELTDDTGRREFLLSAGVKFKLDGPGTAPGASPSSVATWCACT